MQFGNYIGPDLEEDEDESSDDEDSDDDDEWNDEQDQDEGMTDINNENALIIAGTLSAFIHTLASCNPLIHCVVVQMREP